MSNKYYTWILVLLALALAVLVLMMTVQDQEDDSGVMTTERVRDQKRVHQEEAPVEVDLMEEGVDFDSDALELTDETEEMDSFEDIDFEMVDEADIKF